MYDYLIVGSGLFGAVCAHELTKMGYRVLVLERRDHIGGNIYTEEIHGIRVHRYGAHIFHTSDRNVWNFVNSFVEFHPFVNAPLARFHDELYNLPFNMNTFCRLWDVTTPEEAQRIIAEERSVLNGKEPKNLEEKAISLVGTTIYEKMIRGYTSKQWGRSCLDLPPSIISRIPVRFTYDNNYFDDLYQGIPVGGYTRLIEKMLEGAEVKTKVDFLEKKEHWMKKAKTVIYTGAIDEFFSYCFGPLEYRSLRFETEILEKSNVQGTAVVNYTSEDVPYTRIIEHKHFEGDTTSPFSVITKEYPSEWKPDEERFYPIGDEKNIALYEKYKKKAETLPHVIFGGRLGHYRYCDMDDVIASALELIGGMK